MVRTCVRQVSRRRRGGGNGPLLPLESEVCRGLVSSEVQLRSGREVLDVQITTQRCVEAAEVRERACVFVFVCAFVHASAPCVCVWVHVCC